MITSSLAVRHPWSRYQVIVWRNITGAGQATLLARFAHTMPQRLYTLDLDQPPWGVGRMLSLTPMEFPDERGMCVVADLEALEACAGWQIFPIFGPQPEVDIVEWRLYKKTLAHYGLLRPYGQL